MKPFQGDQVNFNEQEIVMDAMSYSAFHQPDQNAIANAEADKTVVRDLIEE